MPPCAGALCVFRVGLDKQVEGQVYGLHCSTWLLPLDVTTVSDDPLHVTWTLSPGPNTCEICLPGVAVAGTGIGVGGAGAGGGCGPPVAPSVSRSMFASTGGYSVD